MARKHEDDYPGGVDEHEEKIEEAYRAGILTKAEAESADAWAILQQAKGRSLKTLLDAAEVGPLSKEDADRLRRACGLL